MFTKLYCLSGPSSTGKSTLLRELKKYLPDAIFVEEWARKVYEDQYSRLYPNLDALLAERASEFQLELARKTIGNRIDGKVVIIDRAPLDILVYTMMQLDKIGAGGIQEIMGIVLQTNKEVDAVFMTRNSDFYEFEPAAYRSEEYQRKRQLEVSLFEHFGQVITNKVISLPDKLEDRVKSVLAHLEGDGVYSGMQQFSLL